MSLRKTSPTSLLRYFKINVLAAQSINVKCTILQDYPLIDITFFNSDEKLAFGEKS